MSGAASEPGLISLNFIRLLRVAITPSVMSLLRGENDSNQSDEFQATKLFASTKLLNRLFNREQNNFL